MKNRMNRTLLGVLVSAACVASLVPITARAQTAAVADAIELGTVIPFDTATASSLDELLDVTVGTVQPEAAKKYGTFEAYWKATRRSREGLALEAIVADTVDGRYQATGAGRRMLATAWLKFRQASCDLVEVDKTNRVVRQFQSKRSPARVLEALTDPNYAGMDIVTTQDSLDALKRELAKEQVTATLKGRSLKPKYRVLEEALESGRMLQKLPCGAPLPTKAQVAQTARRQAHRLWKQAVRRVAQASSKAAGRASKLAARSAGRAVGAGLKVVPVAATGYEVVVRGKEVFETERRFDRGEITQEEREVDHTRAAGEVVGGVVGAVVGAKSGAAAGATIGGVIGGPPGVAIGSAVGAIGGAVVGALGGEVVVGQAAAAVTRSIHRAGTTIADATGRARRAVADKTRAAWRHVWGD